MGLVRYPAITPQLPVGNAFMEWELRPNVATFASPITGATKTLERGGSRFAAVVRYHSLTGAQRGRLKAFLSECAAAGGRFFLRDWSYAQRGSFTQSQLVTEPDFDNGGAAWTDNSGSAGVVTYQENAAIFTRYRRSSSPTEIGQANLSATIGVPYLITARAFPIGGDEFFFDVNAGNVLGSGALAVTSSIDGTTEAPLVMLAPVVPYTADIDLAVRYISSVAQYRNAALVDHASVSRCAIIDVPENLLTYSEQFDNAAWTKTRSSVSANAADFGSETLADELIESSDTSTTHYCYQDITKTAAEEMVTISVYVRRGTGTRNIGLYLQDTSLTDYAIAVFGIGATPAVGETSSGGAVTQIRATVETLPDIGESGWFRVALSAIVDDETTLRARIAIASSNTVASLTYTGNGSNSLYLFGGQVQFSALPGYYQQTTSAALLASAANNPGRTIPLKGLPPSSTGLLLPGDVVQTIPVAGPTGSIRSQLAEVTAPLNSDEGGRGYLNVSPRLQWAPDISARYRVTGSQVGIRIEPCVKLWRPEGRFMLEGAPRWTERHGGFSDLEFSAVEDIAQ